MRFWVLSFCLLFYVYRRRIVFSHEGFIIGFLRVTVIFKIVVKLVVPVLKVISIFLTLETLSRSLTQCFDKGIKVNHFVLYIKEDLYI